MLDSQGFAFSLSGLDAAAADTRVVFTNITIPDNSAASQAIGGQVFRNEVTLTLHNDGAAPLAVLSAALGGAGALGFQIVSAPSSIPAGGSAPLVLRFVGTDPAADRIAVRFEAELTITTDAPEGGVRSVALAGLAQARSELQQEPTVADIAWAFGYGSNMAQSQLRNGGRVQTVGDEVLAPYLERLDPGQPVEVIQLAAFLRQTDVARLFVHGLDNAEDVTELLVQDDQQGQTVSPEGLVTGPGSTGNVAAATFDPAAPFGVRIAVDGRPTFAAWSDPVANRLDPDLAGLVGADRGHLIRYFVAKDASGAVIPGTYIGFQDYPGGSNFDYNDHMFLIRNVRPHVLTAADDANGNNVNDALETDTDGNGTVDFFDPPPPPPVQTIVVRAAGTGGPAVAPQFHVIVDGVVVDTFTIADPQTQDERRAGLLDFRDYTVTLPAGTPPGRVEIQYFNDGQEAGGENRNLYVDRITVNGTAFEAEASTVVTQANGTVLGATDTMLRNGTMLLDLPDTGGGTEQTVIVRAAGTGGPVVAPQFRVIVDGVVVETFTIADPQTQTERRAGLLDFRDYAVTFESATPPGRVEVQFFNDGTEAGGENRNLYVDRVTVNGQVLESEVSGVVTQANGTVLGPTDTMLRDGTLAFDLAAPLTQLGTTGTTLAVRAAGTGGPVTAPQFEVFADGVSLGTRAISNPGGAGERAATLTFETFEFVLDGDTPPADVRIVFFNNGTDPGGVDRDLLVDYIVVGDRQFEAEVDGTVVQANGTVIGATQLMVRNGTMIFDDLSIV